MGHIQLGLSYDERSLHFKLHVKDAMNVTAAHLHCGVPGMNGPVVATLHEASTPMDMDHDYVTDTLTM